jgi:enolase
MAAIQGIYAREILDSRGIPTIECTLWMDNGGIVVTSVPSGTSVGKYEALELRDKDPNHMNGKGVLTAVNNINTIIAPQLIGRDPANQEEIDNLMISLDGTPEKSRLGANAILGVSQAVLKAAALSANQPLYFYIQQRYQLVPDLYMPTCIFTIANGGEHGADNLDIQEFQVVPASHIDFLESLNIGVFMFHQFEEVLISKGAIHSTGIVGGFTPNLYSNSDLFEILVETVKTSPYTFAQDIFFGVDIAASTLMENGKYRLKDRSEPYSSEELLEYYRKLRDFYHVFYIEDPYEEDDLKAWQNISAELGETTKIVGDSLLVTNLEKTRKAIENKTCNTLLVKPNQTGTVTETIEVIKLARSAGWQIVMSHRSGETNDDFIADLAVGTGADYTKFGPPNRGERVAKYNRLLQIYTEMQQRQGESTKEKVRGMSHDLPGANDPSAKSAPTTEPPLAAEPTAAQPPPTPVAESAPPATTTPDVQ